MSVPNVMAFHLVVVEKVHIKPPANFILAPKSVGHMMIWEPRRPAVNFVPIH